MTSKLSLGVVTSQLLTFGMLAVCYLQLGYLLADQPCTTTTSNKLYPAFEGKPFKKVIDQINDKQKVVIRGKHKEGLYLFLDYYSNTKIVEGFQLRKQTVSDNHQLSFDNGGFLSLGWILLDELLFPRTHNRELWIIDVQRQLTLSELNRIQDFGARRPNTKMIFVEEHQKEHISKLPIISIPPLKRTTIQKTLVQHGVSKGILKSLFTMFGEDVEVVDFEVNRSNLEKAMLEYLALEVARIRRIEDQFLSSAQAFEAVCRGNDIDVKDQLNRFAGALIVDTRGSLLWANERIMLAYQVLKSRVCKPGRVPSRSSSQQNDDL